MTIKLEVWKSDHNREERHWFIQGGDTGYQHNTYLFGYNPQLIDDELASMVLEFITTRLQRNG